VSFKFVELAEALVSIFSKKTVPFSIASRLGFGTPIGVITVPIDHAGTLPVPQLPSLSMANAGVGGLSPSGARVSVTLNVRNNNAFVLPLGPLRYALSVEGAPIVSAATAPTQLGAGATLPLVLSAELDFVRVGMGVLRALRSGGATLALDGSFDLAGYAMPVHLQTTLQR
jgi:late embryogenesis abundant protein